MTVQDQTTTATPETATVTLSMGRKAFNSFLADHCLEKDDDSWKVADVDFELDADATKLAGGFDRIEVFTTLPGGPIVALHKFETDSVIVICPKPGPGIYRTAQSIIDELRKGRAA